MSSRRIPNNSNHNMGEQRRFSRKNPSIPNNAHNRHNFQRIDQYPLNENMRQMHQNPNHFAQNKFHSKYHNQHMHKINDYNNVFLNSDQQQHHQQQQQQQQTYHHHNHSQVDFQNQEFCKNDEFVLNSTSRSPINKMTPNFDENLDNKIYDNHQHMDDYQLHQHDNSYNIIKDPRIVNNIKIQPQAESCGNFHSEISMENSTPLSNNIDDHPNYTSSRPLLPMAQPLLPQIPVYPSSSSSSTTTTTSSSHIAMKNDLKSSNSDQMAQPHVVMMDLSVPDQIFEKPLLGDKSNNFHEFQSNNLLDTQDDNFKSSKSLIADRDLSILPQPGVINSDISRKKLYTLISQQLLNDGYANLASKIVEQEEIQVSHVVPSRNLENMIIFNSRPLNPADQRSNNTIINHNDESLPNSPSLYKTNYITTHKDSCLCACFSSDSSYFATGSADKSFKVIDANRVTNKNDSEIPYLHQHSSQHQQQQQQPYDVHPVIRTFCEHQFPISKLRFHPTESVIFSADIGGILQAFTFSTISHVRAHHILNEVGPIRNFEIHPAGCHFILSTDHPTLRLYDIETFSCFVSPMASDQHQNEIVDMSFSSSGSFYVTSSLDLSIKIWDGRSGRCINTISNVMPSNIKAMTCALDRRLIALGGFGDGIQIWDLAMLNYPCMKFKNPTLNQEESLNNNSIFLQFNETKQYLIMTTSNSNQLTNWCLNDQLEMPSLPTGHNGRINDICHSPSKPCLVTCSSDHRARFNAQRS